MYPHFLIIFNSSSSLLIRSIIHFANPYAHLASPPQNDGYAYHIYDVHKY